MVYFHRQKTALQLWRFESTLGDFHTSQSGYRRIIEKKHFFLEVE
jgi:hypothetical protein